MENNDLQNIWKNIDSKLETKSGYELEKILESKTQKIMVRYYIYIVLGLIITTGFFTFLLLATIDRWDDVYYRINNLTIGFLTLVALISEIFVIRLFRKHKKSSSVKEWLEKSIWYFRKVSGKRISYYILPFTFLLSFLSIHVYYSQDLFIDLFKDEETIYGMIFGTIIGMAVAHFATFRIRKYELKNLRRLEELYNRLCNEL